MSDKPQDDKFVRFYQWWMASGGSFSVLTHMLPVGIFTAGMGLVTGTPFLSWFGGFLAAIDILRTILVLIASIGKNRRDRMLDDAEIEPKIDNSKSHFS